MRQAAARIEAAGGTVELDVRPVEGHTLESLFGGREVFEFFESHRPLD